VRYFIFLQYDGTAYHGWQSQPNATSVQQTIEEKLSLLLQRELFIVGAGRTDAGVHARLMTAHFELAGGLRLADGRLSVLDPAEAPAGAQGAAPTPNPADEPDDEEALERARRDEEKRAAWLRVGRNLDDDTTFHRFGRSPIEEDGLTEEYVEEQRRACDFLCQRMNHLLPADIALLRIVPVRPTAHARFSPLSRTYRYYITTRKSPFDRDYSYRIFWDLDLQLMNRAAARLFTYTDFTSFSRLHTDVKTNNCRIMEACWEEPRPGELVFTIRADRFLRNMVRAVVGTLLLVGRHRLTVEEFCRTIEQRDRCQAGDSAPAQALFLEDIEYPDDIFYGEGE
jgi:tRNA pseudouridine38-40 synthase